MERNKTLIAGIVAVATTAAYGLYRWRSAGGRGESVEPAPQAD